MESLTEGARDEQRLDLAQRQIPFKPESSRDLEPIKENIKGIFQKSSTVSQKKKNYFIISSCLTLWSTSISTGAIRLEAKNSEFSNFLCSFNDSGDFLTSPNHLGQAL